MFLMALKRVQVSLSPAEIRGLDKLAEKYGLNRSSGMRYCLNKILDQEGVAVQKRSSGSK